jgi:hypothetical protein
MIYVLILKKKFFDEVEFFKKNCNKISMLMGDKENKLYYDSYQELKTDVEWFCEQVVKSI